MTFKRKMQERIKGINEIQEKFGENHTVSKALEPIKAEYQQSLEYEIKQLAKLAKVKVSVKAKKR